MVEIVEAVFEDGVFRPLTPVTLAPGQKVELRVERRSMTRAEAQAELRAWQEVYAGFTEDEIDDIERAVLDRSAFAPERDTGP